MGIVNRLLDGRKNNPSIPGRGRNEYWQALGPYKLLKQLVSVACLRGQSEGGVKLVTGPHQVTRLRMTGAVPPQSRLPIWRKQR